MQTRYPLQISYCTRSQESNNKYEAEKPQSIMNKPSVHNPLIQKCNWSGIERKYRVYEMTYGKYM